jgi:energy-coupling factor transporter ATP-binding protein EcfA2
MHTAAHLLEHALSGDRLARGRTIILVTHHVRLCLPHAGYVVELGDGQIMRAGTPTELDHLGLLEEVIQEEDVQQSASGSTQNEITEDEIEDSLRPTRIITDGKLVEEEARAEGRGNTYRV